jgi:hypothetical protein
MKEFNRQALYKTGPVSGTRRFLLFELGGQFERLRHGSVCLWGAGPGCKRKSASPEESGLTLCSNSIRPELYLNQVIKVKQKFPQLRICLASYWRFTP